MYEEIRLLDDSEKVNHSSDTDVLFVIIILCSWMNMRIFQLAVVKERIELMIQR